MRTNLLLIILLVLLAGAVAVRRPLIKEPSHLAPTRVGIAGLSAESIEKLEWAVKADTDIREQFYMKRLGVK